MKVLIFGWEFPPHKSGTHHAGTVRTGRMIHAMGWPGSSYLLFTKDKK
jgi:hypothetical protein